MKIHSLGAEPTCSVRTDGWTDRHDEPNIRFSQFLLRRLKGKEFGECSDAVSSAITRSSITLIGCNGINEQMSATYITVTVRVGYYVNSAADVIIRGWMAGQIFCDLTLFLLHAFL